MKQFFIHRVNSFVSRKIPPVAALQPKNIKMASPALRKASPAATHPRAAKKAQAGKLTSAQTASAPKTAHRET